MKYVFKPLRLLIYMKLKKNRCFEKLSNMSIKMVFVWCHSFICIIVYSNMIHKQLILLFWERRSHLCIRSLCHIQWYWHLHYLIRHIFLHIILNTYNLRHRRTHVRSRNWYQKQRKISKIEMKTIFLSFL